MKTDPLSAFLAGVSPFPGAGIPNLTDRAWGAKPTPVGEQIEAILRRATCLSMAVATLPKDRSTAEVIQAADYLENGYDDGDCGCDGTCDGTAPPAEDVAEAKPAGYTS